MGWAHGGQRPSMTGRISRAFALPQISH